MNEQAKKLTGIAASAAVLATVGAGTVAMNATEAFASTEATPLSVSGANVVRTAENAVRAPQVAGTFSFIQGEVTPLDAIARGMGQAPRYLCGATVETSDLGVLAGDELDSWTISVGGAVEHPFDATIREMIDEATETVVLGCSCAGNPADGLASVNAEVTGVPVATLIGHAVPVEGANTIVFASADGYEVALPLWYVEQHYCPIVFDVNGSPIVESMGGTNQLWLGSTSARYFARDVVSITLEARAEADVPAAPGSGEEGDAAANLPNVGVYFGGEVR